MTSTYEKASERVQEMLHPSSTQQQQGYPQKTEEGFEGQQGLRPKQGYQTQPLNMVQRRQQLGCPKVGAIIAGFPSTLAQELTQHCVKRGIFVSNIGLGCRGHSKKEENIAGVSTLEVIDCASPDIRDHLERARDALEKEGAEVVMILDVGQDCRSIELYNRLKFPFVHSGSKEKVEEIKMYEQATSASNPCVISPFINKDAAQLQLMFEFFARSHPGIFRGWSIDQSVSLAEDNAVASAQRRMDAAIGALTDQDPTSFTKWASGKGTLWTSDDKNYNEHQQHQQRSQREQQQQHEKQTGEQHHEKEKDKQESGSSGGGLMAKLGLTSAATKAKEAVQSAAQTFSPATRSSFTLRSPDGKHSFTVGHEHQGLADVESVLCMADFLADKILKGREPRVWGVKDWVAGENDMNRQIVERLEGRERKYPHHHQQGYQHGQQQHKYEQPPSGASIQHSQQKHQVQQQSHQQQQQQGQQQGQQQNLPELSSSSGINYPPQGVTVTLDPNYQRSAGGYGQGTLQQTQQTQQQQQQPSSGGMDTYQDPSTTSGSAGYPKTSQLHQQNQ